MALEPINFEAGNVQITLEPPVNTPAVGEALIKNTAFPPEAFSNGVIPLGSIGAKASKSFSLGNANVKFGAGIGGGFGVYRSTPALLADLQDRGMDQPMIDRLNFSSPTEMDLYAMQWNYNAEASVNGEVAMGVGVTFGASGKNEGLFATVRSMKRTAKARDAIVETLKGWRMPRQVSQPEDLKPGTWIIAENEGSISLSLGVKYGYDYSWMSEKFKLGGLSGDIGLKIEMAVGASLGFNASGRYATVLCRENSDKKLRLQVFKMRQQGWTFAFDAAVSAKKLGSFPPKDFEQFIKGVFNLHDLQVLKDVEKWIDPNTDLKTELGNALVEYVEGMFTEITGITSAKIDKVIDWLREPIERWHALPNKVASLISDFLKKSTPLDDLKTFLTQLVELTDEQKLKDEIISRLLFADFFDSTPGRWLTAIAGEGILSLLANFEVERERLKKFALQTLAILDSGEIEDRIRELQVWIEKKLGLDAIFAVTNQASFDAIDTWLKKRLSDFLGEEIDFAALREIQKAIDNFRKNNVLKEFYDKGLEAISKKYTAELHYAFQKTTTRTALLDLTFDFSTDPANAAKYLKQALNGKFYEILESQIPGVQLNEGTLTHEIKRRTYLEVGLPNFRRSVEHITRSLAQGRAVDTAEGRLWIFNLEAEDVVAKKRSLSRLSVAVQLTGSSTVRNFDAEGFKYDYTLLLAKRKADRKYLETRLTDIANEYFASQFESPGKGTFSIYLSDLDKALDARGIGGSDEFGTTLTSLKVSLPGKVLGAWKNSPSDPRDPIYMAMSRQVQRLLRRWILRCYVQETKQYHLTEIIYPLLAYSSLPPINKLKFSDGIPIIVPNAVYDWDYRDENVRNAVFSRYSGSVLREILTSIRAELNAADDSWASKYDEDLMGTILALHKSSSGTINIKRNNFESLVFREKEIIDGIVEAGTTFRRFLDARRIEDALESLAKFGEKLTDSFNENLGGIYARGSGIRPLGSLMLVEIAKILDPTLSVQPTAMLELIFLPETSAFDPVDFLDGKRPEPNLIALQQRIVSVA